MSRSRSLNGTLHWKKATTTAPLREPSNRRAVASPRAPTVVMQTLCLPARLHVLSCTHAACCKQTARSIIGMVSRMKPSFFK